MGAPRASRGLAAAAVKKPKRSKYRSSGTVIDGIKFDSNKEAVRWTELQLLERAGQIAALRRQVPFVLAPSVRLDGEKRTKPALRYVADAVYEAEGRTVVEDTKSPMTRKLPAYRIKRHLMATVHGIQIKEV